MTRQQKRLWWVIAALVLAALTAPGRASAPPETSKNTFWVFYGLQLNPAAKGASALWDAGSPNFSVDAPKNSAAASELKPGLDLVCSHAMNIRDACLVVGQGSAGSYQWGAKTGKSLQPGDKIEIVAVKPLPSNRGTYFWIEAKRLP